MFDNSEWDLQTISACFAMTTEQLIAWSESLTPDYMIHVAEDKDDLTFMLYTDGDSGLVAFVEDVEMFENGVKLYMHSGYIDLDPEDMITMLDKFNERERFMYTED